MMKSNSKIKLIINIALLVAIFGVMYYLLRGSLTEIFIELKDTSLAVVLGVLFLGTLYQVLEGYSIKEIATVFQPRFRGIDGLWTASYSAFYRFITFGAGTLISEVNFYRKKDLHISQGIGVTALHMIMYKAAVLTYALVGLIIQFSLFYAHAPKMIPFILAGMILTFVIIAFLIILSVSVRLQVLFVQISHRLFKSEKLRGIVDKCNVQIYSLRETMYRVLKDRTAMLRIYLWNLIKLIAWYLIPYVVLVNGHPELDFLLSFALISFTVILAGVIPSPAGIGSFEFVYLLLFRPLVGTVDAVSSMLLYRFASYIWPFLIGFVYILAEKRKVIRTEIKEIKKENSTESE
ncbi:lysylphosphatidylglycerol synthase transmembrane domain-containing protein [Enterococcus massiliensis]|uniref:lysylphosphatidylglycerol synthase transmembrane domain-containing protein n=1 Tax=Enterococcus massiliensis TaxID=1640685 RepID=UPI0036F2C4EE